MKLTAFLAGLALSLPLIPVASAAPDCARLEAARERTWQQLRRGHSAAQGNRLRAKIRQLNEQIASHCR